MLELSNPEVELAAANAEWPLKAAEATYTDLRVKLESSGWSRKPRGPRAVRLRASQTQRRRRGEAGEHGLTSDVKVKTTKALRTSF